MRSAVAGGVFDRLLDDAALFPPARMEMKRAVAAHLTHEASWYSPLLGPFVCLDTRLGELAEAVRAAGSGEPPLEVSVVLAGGPSSAGELARMLATAAPCGSAGSNGSLRAFGDLAPLAAVAVEVPLGDPGSALESARALVSVRGLLPEGAVVYAEVPWRERDVVAQVLDVLAGTGVRAKLRTGGLEAAMFPSEGDVAHFVSQAVRRNLTFKCTAGLHEAVRVRGRTGFEQMGFANILVGTSVALDGGSERDVEAALAERDEPAVTGQVKRIGALVRCSFAGFGTCSVLEPVEELVRLGLLGEPL